MRVSNYEVCLSHFLRSGEMPKLAFECSIEISFCAIPHQTQTYQQLVFIKLIFIPLL